MGNLYCAREHSVQFFMQFFYTVKLRVYGALNTAVGLNGMDFDQSDICTGGRWPVLSDSLRNCNWKRNLITMR